MNDDVFESVIFIDVVVDLALEFVPEGWKFRWIYILWRLNNDRACCGHLAFKIGDEKGIFCL